MFGLITRRRGGAVFGAVIGFFFFLNMAAAQPAQTATCSATGGGSTLEVGPGKTYSTLGAAVAVASAGDTVCLSAGTYVNNFATVNKSLRIVGVGGLAHLQATVAPSNGKAIIVAQADLVLENIEFSGAAVPDRNGAGIRYEAGNLTVLNSYFHDNENGILSSSRVVGEAVISGSRFDHNGRGDGLTHGIYMNTVDRVTVSDSYFESQNIGHQIKSRALQTEISGSTFEDGPGSATPSYAIDLPNGNVGVITDNTFIQRAGTNNKHVINYGGEVATVAPGSALQVDGNTFINERPGGVIVQNLSAVAATITNNRIKGLDGDNPALIADGQADPVPADNNQVGGFTPHVFQTDSLLALAPTSSDRAIEEYAGDGSLISRLGQPDGIAGNSGIANLGDTLYVSNREQGIAALETTLGTSTFYFGGAGIEALASDGTDLLAGRFDDDAVLRFNSSGALLETIFLDTDVGITGLDTAGGLLFVAGFDTGFVHVFDLAGVLQNSFDTGLGAGVLSGLAYDVIDDTLWLSTGFGAGEIWHFDLAGQPLGNFAARGVQGLLTAGIGVVTDPGDPSMTIAEPAGIAVLAMALLMLLASRRTIAG